LLLLFSLRVPCVACGWTPSHISRNIGTPRCRYANDNTIAERHFGAPPFLTSARGLPDMFCPCLTPSPTSRLLPACCLSCRLHLPSGEEVTLCPLPPCTHLPSTLPPARGCSGLGSSQECGRFLRRDCCRRYLLFSPLLVYASTTFCFPVRRSFLHAGWLHAGFLFGLVVPTAARENAGATTVCPSYLLSAAASGRAFPAAWNGLCACGFSVGCAGENLHLSCLSRYSLLLLLLLWRATLVSSVTCRTAGLRRRIAAAPQAGMASQGLGADDGDSAGAPHHVSPSSAGDSTGEAGTACFPPQRRTRPAATPTAFHYAH